MSEFSSEVSLLARPDEASIREAKRAIESELSETVTVAAEPAVGDGGRGGGGMAARPETVTRELTDQSDQLAEQIAQDERRNLLLEELLENIGGSPPGGGGNILDEILGGLGENLGDAVGGVALTGAASALTGAAGSLTGAAAALTAAAGAEGIGNIVDELLGGGNKIGVEKPDWVPLEPELQVPDTTIPTEDVVIQPPADPLPVENPNVDLSVMVAGPVGGRRPPSGGSGSGGIFDTIVDAGESAVKSVPFGDLINQADNSLTRQFQNAADDVPMFGDLVPRGDTSSGDPVQTQPVRGDRRSGRPSETVTVFNNVTVEDQGPSERRVRQIVKSELDDFERSLERRFSSRGR